LHRIAPEADLTDATFTGATKPPGSPSLITAVFQACGTIGAIAIGVPSQKWWKFGVV